MAKSKNVKTDEEKRRRKTDLQRLRREKIKNNPNLLEQAREYERERYKKRKEQGKIKTINLLSTREQRAKRKSWKKNSMKYRSNQKEKRQERLRFLNENTPPASPNHPFNGDQIEDLRGAAGPNGYVKAGRRKVKKDRAKVYRENKSLKKKLSKMEAKYHRYKSKYYRAVKKKSNESSPFTKIEKLLVGTKVTSEVKRKLLFSEALVSQIRNNYSRTTLPKEKQKFQTVLFGKVLKKYRCLSELNFIRSNIKKSRKKRHAKEFHDKIRNDIKCFLEREQHSTLCPGKKDTVTKFKTKQQKRYLNKSLLNIYTDFRKSHDYFISYSTFCKMRPFWIVSQNVNRRDTCLCIKCENGKLISRKIKVLGILDFTSLEEVFQMICCVKDLCQNKNRCYTRTCENCMAKKLKFNEFNPTDSTFYEQWITKLETVQIKNTTKQVRKIRKELVRCSKIELVKHFQLLLFPLMKHINNRNYQYKTLDDLKRNLNEREVVVHIDFSENFCCKYSAEVQSMHFGGSRQQLSLHTVVTYYRIGEDLLTQSICTVSPSLSHDPPAILEHLKPVFKIISEKVPDLSVIHFISDSPSTQYRNCKMFYIIGCDFQKYLPTTLKYIIWNYTEAGHGKGAPDGIGGCVKRTADSLISMGQDISSFEMFMSLLPPNVKKIIILPVTGENIKNYIFPDSLKTFKGTTNVHQVIWSKADPKYLKFRSLSCYNCLFDSICNTLDKTESNRYKFKDDDLDHNLVQAQDKLPSILLIIFTQNKIMLRY